MRLFILLFLFVCGWTINAESAVSSLVADTSSGLIYESKNASVRQYPASLTKVMTLYLTFNALDNGLLKMDDMLPISAHAAKQPRSKMFLKRGDTIRVKDAIMALIIKSANDAAVVLAEALAPSEADFAKMMTDVARQLGLKNTQFRNASGLHHPEQVTTARDMAVLTIALINHFPQYYKLFSKENFWYRGKEYKTHNRVTQKYAGAEGLKTGYVAAVGYNIISTAKRKNNRLVSVVIGQKTGAIRDKQVMGLLDRGFTATKKPKSVLQKLKSQGKYTSLNNQVKKPNMTKYLAIMEKRLAETKKSSGTIAKARINTLSKPKTVVKQAKAPVIDEIEQGDNTQDENEPTDANETLKEVNTPRQNVLTNTSTASEIASAATTSEEPRVTAALVPPTTVTEALPSVIVTEPIATPATPQPSVPETVPAQVPSAPETAPAQAPSVSETESVQAPSVPETAPAQAPSVPETAPAQAPSAPETVPAQVPSAPETESVQAPSAPETVPAQVPSAPETAPAQAPSVSETESVQAPSAPETESVQAPSAPETVPAQVPSAPETVPAQVPSAPETESAPTQPQQSSTKANAKPQKAKLGKWGIQVGAFSNMQRAKTQAEKAQRSGHFENTVIKVMQNNKIYRARIYGFQSNKHAAEACRKLKAKNIQCLPVL